MLKRVKKWLGIEGVKLELSVPEEIEISEGTIDGSILFSSMQEQLVTEIRVYMVEKYYRGRKSSKLIDEYQLGEISMLEEIEIPANEIIEIQFSLPFSVMQSEMDEIGNKNFLFKGLVGAAKKIKGVKSEYKILAEANVKGTALSPFDSRILSLV